MRNKSWSQFEEDYLINLLYDQNKNTKQAARILDRSYDSVKHKSKDLSSIRRVLIYNDPHIPYEDKEAVERMFEVGKDFDPHEIIGNGDIADFYAVSSHPKAANLNHILSEEIGGVRKFLKRLKNEFPRAKHIYIEGNHENRLQRYINSKAPELFGMVELEDILRIGDLGFEFVPYTPNQKYVPITSCGSNARFVVRHEPLSGGVSAARLTATKAMESTIFAHNHRIEEYITNTILDRNIRGISFGWLGDKTSPVFNYVKNFHTWQTGFGLVWVFPNGDFRYESIKVDDGKCWYNGKLYM